MILEKKHEEFRKWAVYEMNRSEVTSAKYREAWLSYKKFISESEKELVFNSSTIRQYLFWLRERGLKKSSALVYFKLLKAFATYLVKIDKCFTMSPFSEIATPKPDKRLPEFLSIEEARQIIEVIEGYPFSRFEKSRNKVAIGLMLYAGLRKSELLNLRLNDLDLKEKKIRINLGKGAKDRIIAMHPTLAEWIEKYLIYRGKRKIDKLLVCCIRPNTQYSDTGLKSLFKLLKRETGMSRRLYPHLCRHSFATLMLDSGANLEAIRSALGHTKLSTTALYLHCSEKMQAENILKHPLG